ncbi:uncharacterized protein LOC141856680 [Brevipalpus obovatus]|uniref:uncharacterized protein LOC141856680 n=1 Tax=Brevipalpus obovatus TaxID=246614 RepID=UPI003D9EB06D
MDTVPIACLLITLITLSTTLSIKDDDDLRVSIVVRLRGHNLLSTDIRARSPEKEGRNRDKNCSRDVRKNSRNDGQGKSDEDENSDSWNISGEGGLDTRGLGNDPRNSVNGWGGGSARYG